jgi:hypothetical protein
MMTIFNPLSVMMGLAMCVPEKMTGFPHSVDPNAGVKSAKTASLRQMTALAKTSTVVKTIRWRK